MMTEKEARFIEIDALVDGAGLAFNPITSRFDGTSEADKDNNVDYGPTDARDFLGDDVTDEEWDEYVAWKLAQAEKELP
jgi:hypothetical protein